MFSFIFRFGTISVTVYTSTLLYTVSLVFSHKSIVVSFILICTSLLVSKFQVGLNSLLRQGLSEPEFYGDLEYKLKKIVGSSNFSPQFINIISHYKKIGYNINILHQTACLVVNPITVGNLCFPL